MLKIFKNIFSFENLFAIYLLSGYIKALSLAFTIRLPDVTFWSLILISLIFIINIIKNKIIIYPFTKTIFVTQTIIFILLMFSCFYTKSDNYFLYKLILYIIMITSIIIPLLLKNFKIILFVKNFIFLNFMLGLMYLIIYPKLFLFSYNSMSMQVSSLYGASATFSGIALLFLIIFYNQLNIGKTIFLLYFVENLIILLISGARGPLFFTIISILIYFLIMMRDHLLKSIKFVSILLIGIFFTLYLIHDIPIINNMFQKGMERVNVLFTEEGGGNSVQERIEEINFAINKITETVNNFLFGNGIASFGVDFLGIDGKLHPHNTLIEIAYDIGLFGFLTMIYFFMFIAYKIYKYNFYYMPIFFYLFLDLMKSSSYIEIRMNLGLLVITLISSWRIGVEKDINITK